MNLNVDHNTNTFNVKTGYNNIEITSRKLLYTGKSLRHDIAADIAADKIINTKYRYNYYVYIIGRYIDMRTGKVSLLFKTQRRNIDDSYIDYSVDGSVKAT